MPGGDPYRVDGKEHPCKQCLRTFPSYGKLRDHVVNTHEAVPAEPAEVP